MAYPDDFNCYRVSILNDIKRISDCVAKLQDLVTGVVISVEQIKATARARSAIFGSAAGMVSSIATAFIVKSIWGK